MNAKQETDNVMREAYMNMAMESAQRIIGDITKSVRAMEPGEGVGIILDMTMASMGVLASTMGKTAAFLDVNKATTDGMAFEDENGVKKSVDEMMMEVIASAYAQGYRGKS